jgi:hypothetical protein
MRRERVRDREQSYALVSQFHRSGVRDFRRAKPSMGSHQRATGRRPCAQRGQRAWVGYPECAGARHRMDATLFCQYSSGYTPQRLP